jgi:RNA recognition motif-containing protein
MNPNRQLKRQIRDQNQTVCVSNATNSRSPDDLKSRIFIGNLNTSVITKRHLHLIFIEYGDIKAISMHKGIKTYYFT